MKIPCMNKSMVIMNNGQLIINSLWSNSIHEQLFIKLLWTTDHAWTIGLSIWTIDHMANCSCMNKLFIIYEQLFIISKIVHKLFIAWTIGHSMDNPSDIHKILNGCFLFFRFINRYFSMLHGFQTAGCARQQLLAESRGPCTEPCRERGMTRWSRWTGLGTGWWTG